MPLAPRNATWIARESADFVRALAMLMIVFGDGSDEHCRLHQPQHIADLGVLHTQHSAQGVHRLF